MKTVIYKGTSNFQEFGKADFAKADVEQGKLVFERDVPKEVSDEVYEALLSTDPEESIFHDFQFEAGPEEVEEDDSSEEASAKKKAAKKSAASAKTAQTDSGSDQQTLDGGAGTGGTATAPVGNGSSTTGTAT